jgi:hypothetical protein
LFKIAVRKMSENNMIRKKIVIVGDGACGKERYTTTLHTVFELTWCIQNTKGGRSANKFCKTQIRKFADFNIFIYSLCGPSANVTLSGFAICGPNSFVICGLKTS